MRRTASKAPDQKAVDSAKQQITGLGPRPRIRHGVQNPLQFGAREIRIQQQAGLLPHTVLMARAAQLFADCAGAAILPDDCVVDGRAGVAIPDHCGLALVGDADACDIASLDALLCHHLAADIQRRAPQVFWIVFHPPGLREMLGELLLGRAHCLHLFVKQDGAGRGRALIDRQNKCHLCPSLGRVGAEIRRKSGTATSPY